MKRHENICFAVVRFQGRAQDVRALGMQQCLRNVEGVLQARLDAERQTIHILYNGDPQAVHRICERLCETGLDAVAHMAPYDVPRDSEPRGDPALRGGA